MNARVRYLAGLAGQAGQPAAAPTLQPPRQLFADVARPPLRSPGRGSRRTGDQEQRMIAGTAALPGPAGEPAAQPPAAPLRSEERAGDRPGGAPGAPSLPSAPGARAVAAWAEGTHAGTSGPGGLGRPQLRAPAPALPPEPVQPGAPVAPGTGPGPAAPVAGPGPAASTPPGAPAAAGNAAYLAVPPLAGESRRPGDGSPAGSLRPGDAAPARPPTSWADPMWGMPVEVPPTTGPEPATGEKLIPVPPGSRDAGGRARPGGPAAPRDLLPPPGQPAWAAGMPGQDPGVPRQQPDGTNRPRVSIGTIEVTVVPPEPPARAPQILPAAQPVPGRSRPPAPPAGSAGAGRLRDGLRRWHGTAQG